MLLRPDDPNLRSIVEAATTRGRDQVVVQRFVPESADVGRRVIVLDGAPIGVVRRVARGGGFRCNMAAGAGVEADAVTSRDTEICARIADQLAEHGPVFVGIDAFAGTRLSDDVNAWVERRRSEEVPAQAVAVADGHCAHGGAPVHHEVR